MSRGWVTVRLAETVSIRTRDSSNIQKHPWIRLCRAPAAGLMPMLARGSDITAISRSSVREDDRLGVEAPEVVAGEQPG
jgi:hypothetical protein